MTRASVIRNAVRILPVALVLLTGAASAAERPEWDQKEVTRLVEELRNVVIKIQLSEDVKGEDPAVAQARGRMVEELRLLKHNLRYLAQLLSQGEDRKGSWPFAKYCERLIHRVRRAAAETPVLPEQGPLIEKAEKLVMQIARYYGNEESAAPRV
jgi:hypothetical protein